MLANIWGFFGVFFKVTNFRFQQLSRIFRQIQALSTPKLVNYSIADFPDLKVAL